MQSHFSAQTLSEIFRDLFLAERDGVLELTREDVQKRIYISRGLIVYADSNDESDDLAQTLVREGRISEGALEEAMSHCQELDNLAAVLIRRDLLGRDSLSEALRGITRATVQSVFRWQGGTAQFQEGAMHPSQVEGDVLETVGAILDGVRVMASFEAISEALIGLRNPLQLRNAPSIPTERMQLSPADGFILSRIDGQSSLADVVSILPPEEEQVALRFLFGLLVFGIVEFVPRIGEGPFRVANILRDHADRQALEKIQQRTIEQAYESLPGRDPYEMLGVSPSASRDAVARAYEEAKALFGKDRILPHLRERYRSELAVIESRLIEAYLKLAQANGERPAIRAQPAADSVTADDLLVRVEMEKTKAKLQVEEAARIADDYYAKAKAAVREGDYHNAIQFGKLAISYNKDDARYFFILADCQARNPEARWQKMAEENFQRATQLDPWNPEYLVRLGRFYEKRGLKLRAIKQFEEALKLAPTHDSAARELQRLRK